MRFYQATKGALICFILLGTLVATLSWGKPTPSPTPAPSPTPTAPLSGSVDIKISAFAFAPAEVTVKTGTKVTWTNLDAVPHTVTADDKLFDSGTLTKDASYSYTFASAGTYTYYCAYHPYIKGKTIVVE